jgi:Ca2+-binding EF-hand superfamily protein
MSIGGIGSATGSVGGFDFPKMASKMASQMMKEADSNGDGSLDKKEFVSGLTAKGISAEEAGKEFDRLDNKHAGKISKSDVESAIKSGGPKGGRPAGAPPAGGPPPGGAGGTSVAAGESSKTYEKGDTNKDGTVSAAEQLIYELAHPAQALSKTKGAARPEMIGNNVDVNA